MIELIENNIEALKRICTENSVEELYLFGSALTDDFDANSDLDFVVVLKDNLSPLEFGDSFFSLLDGLESLFGRKIDLVSYRVIKNPVFKEEIDRTKKILYAAA